MTKTKKQIRQEAGIDDEADEKTVDLSGWLSLLFILALLGAIIYILNAIMVYFFPSFDLLDQIIEGLVEYFFPSVDLGRFQFNMSFPNGA